MFQAEFPAIKLSKLFTRWECYLNQAFHEFELVIIWVYLKRVVLSYKKLNMMGYQIMENSVPQVGFELIEILSVFNFVSVIAWFGGQLRINFPSKILKFFCNCRSLQARAITKNFKILQGKLICNWTTNYGYWLIIYQVNIFQPIGRPQSTETRAMDHWVSLKLSKIRRFKMQLSWLWRAKVFLLC